MSQNTIYNQRINAAINAGFEIYVSSFETTIMVNTNPRSPYNGECIDLFEDGTYEVYSQFKGQKPVYQVI